VQAHETIAIDVQAARHEVIASVVGGPLGNAKRRFLVPKNVIIRPLAAKRLICSEFYSARKNMESIFVHQHGRYFLSE
jgi:hypothetical protein